MVTTLRSGLLAAIASLAVTAPAVGAGLVHADDRVGSASVSLTADPAGVFGTLNSLVATPAGDILGADDRGLFTWSPSSGWTLTVASVSAPSCSGRKRCYSSPVNSEWGDPSVIGLVDGSFLVIEPTGSAGRIAINRSAAGKMSANWESVQVSSTEWVSRVCGDSLTAATTLYATVGTRATSSPIYSVFQSANAGRTWTRTALADTSEVCEADVPSMPTLAEIEGAAPGTLGYLGGVIAHVETSSVRMVATYGGLFASVDGGASWVPQSRGIGTQPRLRLPYTRFGSTVLLGGYGQQETALFRSGDAGATFTRVTGVPHDEAFTYVRLHSASVAYGAWPTSDTELPPTTGLKVYRSANGGVTWAPINGEVVTVEAGADDTPVLIAEGTAAGSRVIVLSSYGDSKLLVTRSTDSGATWSAPAEMSGCLSNVGEPHVDGNLIMVPARTAAGSRGYCRSSDAGANWAFVAVSSSSQFAPGELIKTPGGSLLLLSALAPYESTNNGASFALKTCASRTAPIGPVASGAYDSAGALWVVYFDSSGASLPEVYRSPDGGCSWDVTSVSGSLGDEEEDQIHEVEPDPDIVESTGVSAAASGGRASIAAAAVRQGSRAVRLLGVGSGGSKRSTVYWGPKPSKVRAAKATSKKGVLTLKLTAPTTKGPGSISYISTCTARGKRTSEVKSASLTRVHRGLSVGTTYKCTVTAVNPMGTSPSYSVTTKIR